VKLIDAYTPEEVQPVLDSMEARGMIRKTGEFRQNRVGVLEPLYDLTKLGRLLAAPTDGMVN
jgi:hypothetical protein